MKLKSPLLFTCMHCNFNLNSCKKSQTVFKIKVPLVQHREWKCEMEQITHAWWQKRKKSDSHRLEIADHKY